MRTIAVAILAALSILALASPAMAFEANGAKWATYQVCYRVDPSAGAYAPWIHQAAAAWSNASQHGFRFVHNPDCQSGVWEAGYVDGPGLNYGFTWLNQEYRGPGGMGGPPEDLQIIHARTIIEEFSGHPWWQFCTVAGCMPGAQSLWRWDPLDCPAVSPEWLTCCGPDPSLSTCVTCHYLTKIGDIWHWPSHTTQATTLHEFGHWLWLGENLFEFDTAMSLVLPCQGKQLAPDDIDGLNHLYP